MVRFQIKINISALYYKISVEIKMDSVKLDRILNLDWRVNIFDIRQWVPEPRSQGHLLCYGFSMWGSEELPNDQFGLVTCHSVSFILRQGRTDAGQLHPEAHRHHRAVLQLQGTHFSDIQ